MSKTIQKKTTYKDPYDRALEIIKENDFISWRRLITELRIKAHSDLVEWRKNNERDEITSEKILEVTEIFNPLISTSLLGVESNLDGFKNQLNVLDEIMQPTGWKFSGRTELVDLPLIIGFFYQALNGAVCLDTNQISLAVAMVYKPIVTWRNFQESKNLRVWNGMPADRPVWDILLTLNDSWNWLQRIFGDKEHFESALCAYYCLLNVVNYCDCLLKKDSEGNFTYTLEVPVFAFIANDEITRRAYGMLMRNHPQIEGIWKNKDISNNDFFENWKAWVQRCGSAVFNTSSYGTSRIPHSGLIKDLLG